MKNRCGNTKRNWFSIGDFGNFTCQKKGYNFVSHPAQLLTVILETIHKNGSSIFPRNKFFFSF